MAADISLRSVTLRTSSNQVDVKFAVTIDLDYTRGLPTPEELEDLLENFPVDIYIENYISLIHYFSS